VFFPLYLCCFVEGFSGGNTAHVGIMPTQAVPSKSSLELFFFFFFFMVTGTLFGEKKKKKKKKGFWLCFWCSMMLGGMFCGCQHCL
jgi:drug/metabolite transporter (DMT)-like permease